MITFLPFHLPKRQDVNKESNPFRLSCHFSCQNGRIRQIHRLGLEYPAKMAEFFGDSCRKRAVSPFLSPKWRETDKALPKILEKIGI